MNITKDSIVSSICGIDSKITLEDLSKHLEMDVEEVIELDLGWFCEGYIDLIENDGKLSFKWNGQEDHGITQFLKDVFNSNSGKNLSNFIQDMYLKNTDSLIEES